MGLVTVDIQLVDLFMKLVAERLKRKTGWGRVEVIEELKEARWDLVKEIAALADRRPKPSVVELPEPPEWEEEEEPCD